MSDAAFSSSNTDERREMKPRRPFMYTFCLMNNEDVNVTCHICSVHFTTLSNFLDHLHLKQMTAPDSALLQHCYDPQESTYASGPIEPPNSIQEEDSRDSWYSFHGDSEVTFALRDSNQEGGNSSFNYSTGEQEPSIPEVVDEENQDSDGEFQENSFIQQEGNRDSRVDEKLFKLKRIELDEESALDLNLNSLEEVTAIYEVTYEGPEENDSSFSNSNDKNDEDLNEMPISALESHPNSEGCILATGGDSHSTKKSKSNSKSGRKRKPRSKFNTVSRRTRSKLNLVSKIKTRSDSGLASKPLPKDDSYGLSKRKTRFNSYVPTARSNSDSVKESSSRSKSKNTLSKSKQKLSKQMVTAENNNNNNDNFCHQCSRRFLDAAALSTHIEKHLRVKPFECKDCGKSFSSSSGLYSHRLIHTGTKKFKCSFCPKKFLLKGQKKQHERKHTGEKPYKCRYCGQDFLQLIHKQQHEWAVHMGLKMFQCRLCTRSFSQLNLVKTHEKNNHPGQSSQNVPPRSRS